MGLKSVVQEIQPVFAFLRDVWSSLPSMVQLLMWFVFGTVVFITVLKSLWG